MRQRPRVGHHDKTIYRSARKRTEGRVNVGDLPSPVLLLLNAAQIVHDGLNSSVHDGLGRFWPSEDEIVLVFLVMEIGRNKTVAPDWHLLRSVSGHSSTSIDYVV